MEAVNHDQERLFFLCVREREESILAGWQCAWRIASEPYLCSVFFDVDSEY